MLQPNNIRNRWRRRFAAHAAYGWATESFRDIAWYLRENKVSYSSNNPAALDHNVPLYGPKTYRWYAKRGRLPP